MKEIKLLSMELENFKGIKSFKLEPNGKSMNIYGANATGKTTLFDFFYWMLFDKDSRGQSNFDIKTLDEDGNVLEHDLKHGGKLTLDIEGSQLTLKKYYYEKWQRKRGTATEEFTGHTTDYYISGVPVKKSEYDTKISEIINEEVFKLLTDPMYLNEQLHWEKRRAILTEICGDINSEEVLSKNDELESLQKILEDYDVEQYRSMLKGQKKEIDNKLKDIPIRIDEVFKGLPDISELDIKDIKENIKVWKEKKKEKEAEISRIENNAEVVEKKKLLAEIETDLIKIQNKYEKKYKEKIEQKEEDIKKLDTELSELTNQIKNLCDYGIPNLSDRKDALEGKISELKKKWYETNQIEPDVCPTCGQNMDTKQFNIIKAEKLEEINKEGKEKKIMLEEIKEKLNSMEKELAKAKEESDKLSLCLQTLQNEKEGLLQKAKEYEDDFDYKKKLTEKAVIERKIEEIKDNKQSAIDEIQEELNEINTQIALNTTNFNLFDKYEAGQKRLKELKAEKKKLAAKYEELERELYLCEQYEKTKAELLEERVNDYFELATFKLFDKQVNGAIVPCCETLYKGVPYSTSLNNGARINVGLDIIRTLSKFYGIKVPVFIDNSESVTDLLDIDTQMIRLIVSREDKLLRMEAV